MIKVHDSNGLAVFLAPAAIATITEASVASQWHGIRSYVRTFDGRVIEAQETPSAIADAVVKAEVS